MWIISFLPEWVFHAIFLTGLVSLFVGFILSFVPFIGRYKIIILIIGAVILSLGLFLEGGLADSKILASRVKELEAKIEQAQQESKKANTEIVEKIVYKDRVIKENALTIKQYIDREVVKYDNSCVIPDVVVKAHNAAAKNQAIEEKK